MLNKIRARSNSPFIKLILALIAFSFVGIGGASFIKSNKNIDLVKFDHIKNISVEEFKIDKNKEINRTKEQNATPLQQTEDLALNRMIINNLVHHRMINYLADKYHLKLSEEKIVNFVKEIPYFQNDQGEFDTALFKKTFNNSVQREHEYLDSINEQLVTTILYKIFANSFIPGQLMQNNLITYLSESRVADLISVRIDAKTSNYQAPVISQDDLHEFYQANKEKFTTSEEREFSYLLFDQKYWQQKIQITEQELQTYFAEYKDQFTSDNFVQNRAAILQELTNIKIAELKEETEEKLIEDIESGLNFTELAKKYNLTPPVSKNIFSIKDMQNHHNKLYVDISDSVFELIEGEISYPIELSAENNLAIITLHSISPAKQLALTEVTEKIEKLLLARALKEHNFQNLKQFKNSYKDGNYDKNLAAQQHIKIEKEQTYQRMNLSQTDNNQLATNLLTYLFKIEKDQNTPIFNDEQRLYFTHLRKITTDPTQIQNLNNEQRQNYFSKIIQQSLIEELITYLANENNMKFEFNELNN